MRNQFVTTGLEHRQILLVLEGADMDTITVPLQPLVLDQLVENVIAERLLDQLGFLRQISRLGQRTRQRQDLVLGLLLRGHFKDVLFDRLGKLVVAIDSLESGRQNQRKRQIWIARRIGGAKLNARRLLFADSVHRYPYEARTVAPSPTDIDRSFISGYQPLVGINPLIEYQCDLGNMGQDAGDKMPRQLGQIVLRLAVEKQVLIRMHKIRGFDLLAIGCVHGGADKRSGPVLLLRRLDGYSVCLVRN